MRSSGAPPSGLIEVEAGTQRPDLLAYLLREQPQADRPWAFRQKQTGADRLSIGGAVAANGHGRGLAFGPLVDDVEVLTLVDARGDVRLDPRRTLERVVEVRDMDGLVDAFDERIRDGFLYGDFQFMIDPADPDFLRRGVFSCYRPVDDGAPLPTGQRTLTRDDWRRLLYLAHFDMP